MPSPLAIEPAATAAGPTAMRPPPPLPPRRPSTTQKNAPPEGPPLPVARGDRAGSHVGRHDGDALDALRPPQRAEHIREHRLHERPPAAGGQRVGQALLRGVEALDRDDGERSHERECATLTLEARAVG